ASCPAGTTCTDGACVAPAGTGAIGDACASDAACASQLCAARGGDHVCSEPCWPTGATCEGGLGDLSCQHADDERLVCLPPAPDEGGCCTTSRDPRGPLALALLSLAFLSRTRPRRQVRACG
ncbi:MAG TPA: hypothetical protein VHE35_20350, partial [Kofleriaceae bacterium]|nr:hypothetical protein [Kofleriaceae bacterium]